MEKKNLFKPTGHKDIDRLFKQFQTAVSQGEFLHNQIQEALDKKSADVSEGAQAEKINKISVVSVEEEKEHYKKFFRNDPLFRFIELHRDVETLMHIDDLLVRESYFNLVQRNKTYTSDQASKILGIDLKHSHISKEIQREGFREYLSLQKSGEEYRYDWINLFKIKMLIFVYKNIGILSVVKTILGAETSIVLKDNKSEPKQTSKHLRNDELSEIISNLHRMTDLYNIELKETRETYKEVLFATMKLDSLMLDSLSDKARIHMEFIRYESQLRNISAQQFILKEYLDFLETSKSNYRSKKTPLFVNRDAHIYDIANRISSVNMRLEKLDDEKKELEQKITEQQFEILELKERTETKFDEVMKRVFPEKTEL